MNGRRYAFTFTVKEELFIVKDALRRAGFIRLEHVFHSAEGRGLVSGETKRTEEEALTLRENLLAIAKEFDCVLDYFEELTE